MLGGNDQLPNAAAQADEDEDSVMDGELNQRHAPYTHTHTHTRMLARGAHGSVFGLYDALQALSSCR